MAVAPAGLRGTEPFQHVGIAYDGSVEARAALAAGYRIAADTEATVTVLYAGGAQHVLDEAAAAAPPDITPRTRLLHGAPAGVIAGACDGVVDLLVTGSRSYGPVQRAMLGSVAEALTEGAAHPVLVLPRPVAMAARGELAAAGGSR